MKTQYISVVIFPLFISFVLCDDDDPVDKWTNSRPKRQWKGVFLNPCACAKNYKPVCGSDSQTYSNVCAAHCAGVTTLYNGKCRHYGGRASGRTVGIGVDGEISGTMGIGADIGAGIIGTGKFCIPGVDISGCPGIGGVGGTGGIVDLDEIGGTGGIGDIGGIESIGANMDGGIGSEIDSYTSERWCTCTYDYNPVCGFDGRTYPNICKAKCKEKRVLHQGECIGTIPYGLSSRTSVLEMRACACTKELVPVCGSDLKTYDNKCLAICNRVIVVHQGTCRGIRPASIGTYRTNSQCQCSRIYYPVCGTDGNTYKNKCVAKNCHGVAVLHNGACRGDEFSSGGVSVYLLPPPCRSGRQCIGPLYYKPKGRSMMSLRRIPSSGNCACPKSYVPVCGYDRITYANKCLAKCAGTGVFYNGPCNLILYKK